MHAHEALLSGSRVARSAVLAKRTPSEPQSSHTDTQAQPRAHAPRPLLTSADDPHGPAPHAVPAPGHGPGAVDQLPVRGHHAVHGAAVLVGGGHGGLHVGGHEGVPEGHVKRRAEPARERQRKREKRENTRDCQPTGLSNRERREKHQSIVSEKDGPYGIQQQQRQQQQRTGPSNNDNPNKNENITPNKNENNDNPNKNENITPHPAKQQAAHIGRRPAPHPTNHHQTAGLSASTTAGT